MIKKILVFLVMLSLLGVSGVLAVDQGIEVTIGENITVVITPSTLSFGNLLPGTNDNPATNGPISFNATGSNVDVTVEFTSVTENGLFEGMEVDIPGDSWVPITDQPTVLLDCVIVSELCTYTPVDVDARLDVPESYPQGYVAGAITYTITGSPPV